MYFNKHSFLGYLIYSREILLLKIMDQNLNVFEGVEKRIEVCFTGSENSPADGLRSIDRSVLDQVCSLCKCEIIHHTELPGFDSYILSESSLFVFPFRMIIKTCGTTVPLNGVDFIVRQARDIGLLPLELIYSRTSFMFPGLQQYPHNSLEVELKFLESMEIDGLIVPGRSGILGDPCGKYWLVHRKVFQGNPLDGNEVASVDTPEHRHSVDALVCNGNRVTVDVIMTGLSPEIRQVFYKNKNLSEEGNEKNMSEPIESILPEFQDVQGKCFHPCGYSANGHLPYEWSRDRCFTVHVTPEGDFSYASFEATFIQSTQFGFNDTDALTQNNIQAFLMNVLSVFSPDSAIVTVLSSDDTVSTLNLPVKLCSGKREYTYFPGPYTAGNLLGEDIVASSVYYSCVSSGNTGTKPTGLS
jgi:S-adenosylmethionine decarboxylase